MKMPAIFVGHGSPMNAISSNEYTKEWNRIGQLYKPKGIIVISGHWFTSGNRTQDSLLPKKIDDMYGFPKELYDKKYPVKGDKAITQEIVKALGDQVEVDNTWGIDHGTWSFLVHMYPKADIPVVQLSVDHQKTPFDQFVVGQKISHLRELGYMILGSGNVVHNLGLVDFNRSTGFPWAIAFDEFIEQSIKNSEYEKCINYLEFGNDARLSVPTPDHFYPLLNILGTVSDTDQVTVFNNKYDVGGLAMTSYIFDS